MDPQTFRVLHQVGVTIFGDRFEMLGVVGTDKHQTTLGHCSQSACDGGRADTWHAIDVADMRSLRIARQSLFLGIRINVHFQARWFEGWKGERQPARLRDSWRRSDKSTTAVESSHASALKAAGRLVEGCSDEE